jgi:hypothetical protein
MDRMRFMRCSGHQLARQRGIGFGTSRRVIVVSLKTQLVR